MDQIKFTHFVWNVEKLIRFALRILVFLRSSYGLTLFSIDFLTYEIYNEFCNIKNGGGLLKNDTRNETTFPILEPVIEYGQEALFVFAE